MDRRSPEPTNALSEDEPQKYGQHQSLRDYTRSVQEYMACMWFRNVRIVLAKRKQNRPRSVEII